MHLHRPARSVSVRVRPLNKQEEQEAFAWRIEGNSIVQLDSSTKDVDRAKDTKYVLDHVFGPDWTTEMIYEVTTQKLIHKIVNGFNSTVFAYGQTSSGKTHTMRGTADGPGIIPLAVAEAFKLIEMNDTREYLIRVSYMEVSGILYVNHKPNTRQYVQHDVCQKVQFEHLVVAK